MALLGQSFGENKGGAAEKERIGEIVQAVADVGGGSEIHGEIDEKDKKKNHDAEINGREARLPVDENAGAGQEQDSAREIGPEDPGRDVTGREAVEGNARNIAGMKKVEDGKDKDGDGDEKTREGDEEGGGGSVGVSTGESEGAAAEGEVAESNDPREAAGGIGEDIGEMNQDDEEKEHDSEKSGGEADMAIEDDA